MGCSSSVTVKGAGVNDYGPELVLVGGQLYGVDSPVAERIRTIDIYNLGRNRTKRSLDMPKTKEGGVVEQLTQDFAAVCSPTRPVLYIAGGLYGNLSSPTAIVWSIHLSGRKGCYQRLPDMPIPLSNHKMCHATINEEEILFVIGGEDKCFQYSFKEKNWFQLRPLPIKIRHVDAVMCINQCLYVCGDGYLLLNHLRDGPLGRGDWFINQESSFPKGNVAVLGDKIFVHKYDYKDNFIYVYDTWDDSLHQFAGGRESDIKTHSGITSLSPDILYFAGGFDELLKRSSNAVVEYSINSKRSVIACFLDLPRENHLMFINRFPHNNSTDDGDENT